MDDKTEFCDLSEGRGTVFWSWLLIWAAEGLGGVWNQQPGDGEELHCGGDRNPGTEDVQVLDNKLFPSFPDGLNCLLGESLAWC